MQTIEEKKKSQNYKYKNYVLCSMTNRQNKLHIIWMLIDNENKSNEQ